MNIRTENLPAAAGRRAFKGLIVDGQAGQSEKKIRFWIAAPRARVLVVAILESFGFHIHLVGADAYADLDVVLTANHVERVTDGKYVGAADKWREAAIANGEEVSNQLVNRQATANAGRGALIAGVAVQICPGNSEFGCLTGPCALRSDVVEDSVVTAVDLIDSRRRKNVRLRKCNVAAVVDDALIARKKIGFRCSQP